MSEKRFVYGVIKGSRQAHIKDCHNCKSATIDVYDDDFKYFVDLLNEQQATNDYLEESNSRLQIQLGETLRLVDEQQATIEEQNKEIEEFSAFIIEQRKEIKTLKEENEQLQAQLREKEEDEQLYADEIVKLNKEAKEVLDFKSLGGDY